MKRTTKQVKAKPPKVRAISLIEDPRQRLAIQILSEHGYTKGARRRTGAGPLAARAAKVDITIIYEWLKEPNFLLALEEQKVMEISSAIRDLREASKKGNVTAAIYRLKLLDPESYDDQMVRDRARQKHDFELQKIKNEGLEKAFEKLTPLAFAELSEDQIERIRTRD